MFDLCFEIYHIIGHKNFSHQLQLEFFSKQGKVKRFGKKISSAQFHGMIKIVCNAISRYHHYHRGRCMVFLFKFIQLFTKN